MTASSDPYIGREIDAGKYKILQKIGAGGMGAVYKALQLNIDRLVAIKVLHAKLIGRKDLVSRFSREAKALSHLSHPNTVKVFDDGVLDDGSLYIVMEFLEGRNLNQTVRAQGPLAPSRALPVIIQICGALEEAHQQGIVHRDLKPENIFLCNQGGLTDFPKVLDFGLAKVTEREMRPGSIILTQEGMVFGTPEFMSPEQAQGKTLDARSDVYSLATIIYEVLTGKLPFDAKLPMEYIQLHVAQKPIALDERVPGLTFAPGLGDVIATALAKDPAQRYQSAAAFAAALEPYAGGKGNLAGVIPSSASQRAARAQPAPPPQKPPMAFAPLPQAVAPAAVSSRHSSSLLQASPTAIASRESERRSLTPAVLVALVVGCLVMGAVLAFVAMRVVNP